MGEYAEILLGAILVYNFVLVQFLGLCPFIGTSSSPGGALGMSLATTFVLCLAAAITYLLHRYLLAPLALEYLRTMAFILVIAASTQFAELYLRHANPVLHRALGIFLPLITTNCMVLGLALLNIQRGAQSLLQTLIFAAGAALGFSLALILFAALRERLEFAAIPTALRGSPIALISAGLAALGFVGFGGMI